MQRHFFIKKNQKNHKTKKPKSVQEFETTR